MREALKKSSRENLQTVILSEQEFTRARIEEHELKLNHQFFDIAFIEKIDDRYAVYGLYDTEEEALFSYLLKKIKRHSNDKKAVPFAALAFLSLTFLPTSFKLSIPSAVSVAPTYDYSLAYTSVHLPKEVPPPDLRIV